MGKTHGIVILRVGYEAPEMDYGKEKWIDGNESHETADALSVYAQIDMIRRIIPILLKSSLTHDVHWGRLQTTLEWNNRNLTEKSNVKSEPI